MKALLLILTVVTSVSCFASEELFERANSLYSAEQFVEAEVMYDSLVSLGHAGSNLYYNLANTKYKLNKIPEAILFYERAKRIDPSDEDIQFNLQLAKLKVVSKIDESEDAVLTGIVNGFLNTISLKLISWLSIVLIWIAFLAGVLFLFGNTLRLRRVGFFSMLLFASLFLVVFLLALLKNHHLDNSTQAILMSTNSYIKSAPDSNSTDLFILHGGVKMTVLDEVNEYYKIRIADGKVGWIEASAIEKI